MVENNEDVSSSTEGENLSPVDEVANLLTGGGPEERTNNQKVPEYIR